MRLRLRLQSRRRTAMIAAGAMAALLSGCGGMLGNLTKPAEHQVYRIEPLARARAGLSPGAVQLAVAAPSASGGLDGRDIALIRSPGWIEHFADAEWSDPVPALVQTALIERFEANGKIAAAPERLGLDADFALETAIRHFEARYDTPSARPRVRVAFDLKLVSLPRHKIVAETVCATEQEPATGPQPMLDIVGAFGEALHRTAGAAAAWTQDAVAAAARTAAPPLSKSAAPPALPRC